MDIYEARRKGPNARSLLPPNIVTNLEHEVRDCDEHNQPHDGRYEAHINDGMCDSPPAYSEGPHGGGSQGEGKVGVDHTEQVVRALCRPNEAADTHQEEVAPDAEETGPGQVFTEDGQNET